MLSIDKDPFIHRISVEICGIIMKFCNSGQSKNQENHSLSFSLYNYYGGRRVDLQITQGV